MLRPSYTDLLDILNKEGDPRNIAGSRYTIVIAAAKRARELVNHAESLTTAPVPNKPVSIAVQELYEGKINITEGGAAE